MIVRMRAGVGRVARFGLFQYGLVIWHIVGFGVKTRLRVASLTFTGHVISRAVSRNDVGLA